jgi:predicted N-acetyltransferase YhbS
MEGERDDLIIRALKPEDTPRLARMDQQISGRGRQTWYERKIERSLVDTDVMISLGAEMNGLLVGAILGSLHFGEFGHPEPVAILDTLLVDRDFGRKGIGSALLDQLLKNLRGLRISSLRTEVGWNELELLAFFGKVGFLPVPRLVLEIDVEKSESAPFTSRMED